MAASGSVNSSVLGLQRSEFASYPFNYGTRVDVENAISYNRDTGLLLRTSNLLVLHRLSSFIKFRWPRRRTGRRCGIYPHRPGHPGGRGVCRGVRFGRGDDR